MYQLNKEEYRAFILNFETLRKHLYKYKLTIYIEF